MPIPANAIPDLYDAHLPDSGLPASGRIHPFVGDAFTVSGSALRVMAVGINCYTGDHVTSHPGWFPAMFRDESHRFQRGVLRETAVVAAALNLSGPFRGFPYLGKNSIYHTNTVKRWVPMSSGKRAHRVPEALFVEGAQVFREELALLATGDVLPHVVLVFGLRAWHHIWPAFGSESRPEWVSGYQSTVGPLFHSLNRVTVVESGEERSLLLMRVKHPTGGRKGLSAAKLVAHPDFRAVLESLESGP